jgi:iron complex outermembrane receptor protein
VAYDLRNNADATNHGLEYQLSWRPRSGTVISLNQYHARPSATPEFIARTIPRRSTGLLASQTWGHGWTTGLAYASVSPMSWLGEATPAGEQRLLSLRVARAFSINGAKADISATMRRPIGRFDEFRELQSLPRQLWISLSVDY